MTDDSFLSATDPGANAETHVERPYDGPSVVAPGADDPVRPDPPEPPDPAALIVSWLRRGFDGLNGELQRTTMAIEQQQADLIQLAESQSALGRVAEAQALLGQVVESQSSEINVSLAELEGCAAQLRNEASSLHNLRSELSVGFGAMMLELREALVRELPALVREAVEPALRAAVDDLSARLDELSVRVEQVPAPAPTPAPAPPAADAPETGQPEPDQSQPDQSEPDLVVPESPETVSAVEMVGVEPVAEVVMEQVGSASAPPVAAVAPGGDGASEEELPGTDVTCVLPGLAVGPSLAVAVTAALERSRVRRRRRRPAGAPSAGLHRHDPYAGDVGRRLERFALARGDSAFETRSADALPELRVATGEYGGHEFAIDLSVLGSLCLVGPHSAGVARALASSLLSQPGRARAEVISVAGLLPASPSIPELTHAESTQVALDRLEREVADRAKLLADDGADSVVTYNARHPDQPVTPLLVATSRLAEGDGPRLRTLVAEGRRLGVAAVVVDAEIEGSPSLQLKAGGVVDGLFPESTLGGLVGARLFLLSSDAMGQILSVLTAARTDNDDGVADDEPFVVPDPPGEVPIQVQLLGPYRIDAAGKEIHSGLRAKARELLAFYLLHPEGTTLDTATEALWPEADPGRGSEWFWTALGNLRSLLRSTTGIKELKVIEREGEIYKVEPIFDVDLWRLQQVLAEVSSSGDRAGDGAGADELWTECLQRGAELYSGELLEGADWAWAMVPRDDLRRRAVDVLVSLAATRLVTGDTSGALELLEKALDIDPYSEQLYRRVMRLQGKLARPDAVEAAFLQLQARLAEIDLEPTPETQSLNRELSASG